RAAEPEPGRERGRRRLANANHLPLLGGSGLRRLFLIGELMSDISQTAANVKIKSNATLTQKVRYGATVAQGDVVYSDLTDNGDWKLADADAAITAVAGGIALTPGVDGDYGYIATAGPVDVGGTL